MPAVLGNLQDPALLDDPCLGHALARQEARIALGSLVTRFPRLTLDPDAPPRRSRNFSLRGFVSLPVLF